MMNTSVLEIVTDHELNMWLTSAHAAYQRFENLNYAEVAAVVWVGLINHLIGQREAKRLAFEGAVVEVCPLITLGLMIDEWREYEGKEFIVKEQQNLASYMARAINGQLSGKVTRN